jgi:hypothetical protein
MVMSVSAAVLNSIGMALPESPFARDRLPQQPTVCADFLVELGIRTAMQLAMRP